MAKLSGLSSSVGRLKPRIGHVTRQEAEVERLTVRDRTVKWRGWYKTKRWYDLRDRVFVRDGYVCQKTGELLIGKSPAPNSPVAHHKIAHRGDPKLFWDESNVETVSKAWHDGPGQAEEWGDMAARRRGEYL